MEIVVDLEEKMASARPGECLLVLFDRRVPGAEERLERERAAWRGSAVVEPLDEHHYVLIFRPGGALRLAA